MPIFVMFITAWNGSIAGAVASTSAVKTGASIGRFLMKITAMALFVAGAFEAYEAWPRRPDTSVMTANHIAL